MEYSLRKGEAMSLSTCQSRYSLSVTEGTIWLTCPDDTRDYFLKRGKSFDTENDGQFVLEAMVDAKIVIESRNPKAVSQLTIQVNLELTRRFPISVGRITRPC